MDVSGWQGGSAPSSYSTVQIGRVINQPGNKWWRIRGRYLWTTSGSWYIWFEVDIWFPLPQAIHKNVSLPDLHVHERCLRYCGSGLSSYSDHKYQLSRAICHRKKVWNKVRSFLEPAWPPKTRMRKSTWLSSPLHNRKNTLLLLWIEKLF